MLSAPFEEMKKSPPYGQAPNLWYTIKRTTELGRLASSGKEVMPMSFSFHEMLLFGMFILALLTYLKRK